MPIRNPFRRNADEPALLSATIRPGSAGPPALGKLSSFERVDTVGSSASTRRSQDTGDYQMSVVDSGVYLPPSPTERDAFWSGPGPRRTYMASRSTLSRTSTDRSSLDIEHISRESFDSYRRSFDICAKSPVSPVSPVSQTFYGDSLNNTRIISGRQSLDSAPRHMYTSSRSRPAAQNPMQNRFPPADEGFEDVGLDDSKATPTPTPTAASSGMMHAPSFMRKRGFFRFGSEQDSQTPADSTAATATASTNGSAPIGRLLGRKRAQSGQGAELAPINKTDLPTTSEHDAES